MRTPTNFPRRGAFQSKLEPFAQIIRELRRRRKSYREVAQILRDEHQITVDRTTIWSFVKVRSRPRRVIAMASDSAPGEIKSVGRGFDAIAALKSRPTPKAKKPLFTYDENQPLTLKTEKS